ncbi:Crp/Fnr family transcriptional regulator [Phenylobacterium sp.]|uniref:Crp/Fnr family transcriptional regulator n=1 Tax=Phenylobacterium sp. TaxID=1871053 RepID=UPI0025FB9A04|nr:Crp/Fnr family transcriptional regulator [Phenylobacterium sp.]
MIERHLMRLRARDDIGAAEEAAIRGAVSVIRPASPGTVLVRAGEEVDVSILLLSGVIARQKDLLDGRRQITELHVAGDFTDLHGFTLKRLDHDVVALSACSIALFPHRRIQEITEQHPHLGRVYWFLTNLDAAIHREWEVSLGRRTALERMAHLFCELQVRLKLVGLADDGGYALPLTQGAVAECLGLTTVHVNRTLKQLKDDGVAELRRGRLAIFDLASLRRVAGFDPAYLYLEKRNR